MFTKEELRVAIVMIERAPLKGVEAESVAQTLQKLKALYEQEAASDDTPTD